MYTLLFFKSPFNTELKLDQMNARYERMDGQRNPQVLDLMHSMMREIPEERLSSCEIWSIIDGIRDKNNQ
jgi:hypothetical protein